MDKSGPATQEKVKCKRCNATIDADAKMCVWCGFDLSGATGNVGTTVLPAAQPAPSESERKSQLLLEEMRVELAARRRAEERSRTPHPDSAVFFTPLIGMIFVVLAILMAIAIGYLMVR